MASTTVIRPQAEGEEGATLRPAGPVFEALVALLEDDPSRPIRVGPTVFLRASAFVPVLIEALERARDYYQPQSIRAGLVAERIAAYTPTPKRCVRCDLLMDSEEAENGDTCGRCLRALSVAGAA